MLKEKTQGLYSTLYQCAKDNPECNFHALYDKIYRQDILNDGYWIRIDIHF